MFAHALPYFTVTTQYIEFLEKAAEASPITRQLVTPTSLRPSTATRMNVLPTWLADALSESRLRELSLYKYYNALFDVCHIDTDHFEACIAFHNKYPQIVFVMIYGGILTVVHRDIDEAFSDLTNLSPMYPMALEKMEPSGMINHFMQQTWDLIVGELHAFASLDHHPIRQPYQKLKRLLQNSIDLLHDNTALLRNWYLSLRLQHQIASEALSLYEEWRQQNKQWWYTIVFSMKLQVPSVDMSEDSPALITREIKNILTSSPYFDTRDRSASAKGQKALVTAWFKTAQAAILLRRYCDQFDPPEQIRANLMSASYIHETEFMTALNQVLNNNPTMDTSWTTSSSMTSLVKLCVAREQRLMICEACAVYYPVLYNALSSVLIKQRYADRTALLNRIHPLKGFTAVSFNAHLMSMYLMCRQYFTVPSDAILDTWATAIHYDERKAHDIYQIYRGETTMWDVHPPTSFIHQGKLDFKTYPLTYIWDRWIALLQSQYDEWWLRLLQAARLFDKWVKRTERTAAMTYLSQSRVEDIIGKMSLKQAMQTLVDVALKVREWSDQTIIPPPRTDKLLSQIHFATQGSFSSVMTVLLVCDQQGRSKWKQKILSTLHIRKTEEYSIPALTHSVPPPLPPPAQQQQQQHLYVPPQAASEVHLPTLASSTANDFMDNNSDSSTQSILIAREPPPPLRTVKSAKSLRSLKQKMR